jgi:hypothetical protein
MANPLKGDTTPGSSNFGRDLAPGEVRVINVRSGAEIIKTITVIRTERDYVHDLCDAYNAARPQSARERGVEWYVNAAGELKIGDSTAWAEREAKRRETRKQTESTRALNRQFDMLSRVDANDSQTLPDCYEGDRF